MTPGRWGTPEFLRAKLVQILEHIEAIPSDTWEEGDQNGDPLWYVLDQIHGLTLAALRPEDCEYYQTALIDGSITPNEGGGSVGA